MIVLSLPRCVTLTHSAGGVRAKLNLKIEPLLAFRNRQYFDRAAAWVLFF